MQTHYYYTKLNKAQQTAYHAMLEGLRACASSFSVPRLSDKELMEIHFLLRLDHPEIFYSEGITWRYYEQASSVEVIPKYLFDKKKIKMHQQAMTARVEKLARPAMKLSEADLLYRQNGERPVILLDDVLSELDNKRQDFLLNKVEDYQVFVTCCEESNKEQLQRGKVFFVNNGEIKETE